MDVWNILGIEKTNNKTKIDKANENKMLIYHPEKNNDDLQKLQTAYKSVTDCNSLIIVSKDIVDEFIKSITSLYSDFSLRISPEAWTKLLNKNLNTEHIIEITNQFLSFLINNNNLPDNVWYLLGIYFPIEENRFELENKFGKDFLDFVINNTKNEGTLRYSLFEIEENKNYDSFIDLFYEIRRNFNNKEVNLNNLFEKAESLNIFHPDMELLKAEFFIHSNNISGAEKIIDSLILKTPLDSKVLYLGGYILFLKKEYLGAESLFNRALYINPFLIEAKINLANTYFILENYVYAEKTYKDILENDYSSPFLKNKYFETNEKLIENYKNLVLENPSNNIYLINLSKCLLTNGYFIESKKQIENMEIENEFELNMFYEIYVDVLINLEKYNEAQNYIKKWQFNYYNDEKPFKFETLILLREKKYDEAILKTTEYIEKFKNEPYFYYIQGISLLETNKSKSAYEIINKGLEIQPNNYKLLVEKANLEFLLKKYNKSLNTIEETFKTNPYNTNMYNLKIKIFYAQGKYTKVLEIINYLKELDFESTELKNLEKNILDMLNEEKQIAILNEDFKSFTELELKDFYLENHVNFSNDENLYIINTLIEKNNSVLDYYLYRISYFIENNEFEKAKHQIIFSENKFSNDNQDILLKKIVLVNKKGDPIKALDLAFEFLNKYPTNQNIFFEIANINLDLKDYENAIKYYSKQIDLNKKAEYFVARGKGFNLLNNIESEKSDYFMALEINPNYIIALEGLGYIFYLEKNYPKSIFYFEKILNKGISLKENYIYLAKSYYSLEKYENALKVLDLAIEYYYMDNPNKAYEMYLEKANLFRFIEQYKESIDCSYSAFKTEACDYKVYKNLGMCFYWLRDYKQAILKYNKAIELNENNYDLYIQRGIANFIGLNKFEKSLTDFLKAKSLNPNLYESYYNLGKVYEVLEMEEKAIENYKKATELLLTEIENFQKRACLYSKLGDCYLGLNKYSDALNSYTKALYLAKNDIYCYKRQCHEAEFGLGRYYEKRKFLEKAMSKYDKALSIKNDVEYLNARRNLNTSNRNFKTLFYILIFILITFIILLWFASNV